MVDFSFSVDFRNASPFLGDSSYPIQRPIEEIMKGDPCS
jgi:hypothetical protein